MKLSSDTVKTVNIFVDGTARFYYVSDIHLELRKKPPKDIIESILGLKLAEEEIMRTHVKSSILLLAGDIGSPFEITYEIFLKRCESYFAHVVIIAGNHEYYSSNTKQYTIRRINRELTNVCERCGVILLGAGDNDSIANRVDVYSREASSESSSEKSDDRADKYAGNDMDYVIGMSALNSSECSTSCDDGVSSSGSDEHNSTKDTAGKHAVTHSSAEHNDAAAGDVGFWSNNHARRSGQPVQIDVGSVDLDAGSVEIAKYEMSKIGRAYESKLVARIVGCTLWTVPTETSAFYMNDYRRIFVEGHQEKLIRSDVMAPATFRPKYGVRCLTVDDVYRGMYLQHRKFLHRELEIALSEGIPAIVMTHHLPSFDLLTERGATSDCYASDLNSMLKTPVVAWICGHTHKSLVKNINGVYCGINCFGYPTQTTSYTGFTCRYFDVVGGKIIG